MHVDNRDLLSGIPDSSSVCRMVLQDEESEKIVQGVVGLGDGIKQWNWEIVCKEAGEPGAERGSGVSG